MMLEYLGFEAAGKAVEEAVRASITAGETTRDLGGTLSTEEAAAAIRRRIRTTSSK
jgi:isocitrate/isopropylmalate dehydrogenase